ncbi:hypothetical protein BD311DRAFT_648430 [Dichomitus squalens]|uniref:Uncharacterized protein n=1 Tax=Dichomitus squalens TaxID=114155 RepID=A0A4Q9N5K5_9APHY|nr:hypothetical protein BD311DRAFT_648430 [Dichomitus squalens]
MSALASLTTSVIILEFMNISLLLLLVFTPAPKHPIVKALMISCLLRSVLDILPPIVHKIIPQKLGIHITKHPATVNFCIVDSILLNYVTVVKAAFAVNFTLPFLGLALLQAKPKRSADDHPHLTRRNVWILCVSPFLWALPVLLTPIHVLSQGTPKSVQYNITSCYFDDPAFTIVSLIFTLIPLAVSTIVAAVLAVVIWRFSTMLDRTGWHFAKTKRFARFGALVLVTMISASLYTVVLSQWIHLRRRWPDGDGTWTQDTGWVRIIRTSVLWEGSLLNTLHRHHLLTTIPKL